MSITDELRKHATNDKLHYLSDYIAIADRIDAEHERQLEVLYRDMSDAEYIRLPKDRDGVPIHIGDVMAYADNTKPMEVVALVPPAVFLTEDGPRYADMCRHYHAPTVEDVLREMLYKAHIYDKREMELLPDLIAEYAAKLQLKENA